MTLEWVELCCIACRRRRRMVSWVAALPDVCRHTGTELERPFWRASGEPKFADLIDEKERRHWAKAEVDSWSELAEASA